MENTMIVVNALVEAGFNNSVCLCSANKYKLLMRKEITTGDRHIKGTGWLDDFFVVKKHDDGWNARRTNKIWEDKRWCEIYKRVFIDHKEYYIYIGDINLPGVDMSKCGLPIIGITKKIKVEWEKIQSVINNTGVQVRY